MKSATLKRLTAIESKAVTLMDFEPIRLVTVDGDFTLEESEMLKAYHGKPERGGRITEIRRVLISPNDRPARPLAELIRVWDAAVMEGKHERT